MAVLEIVNSAIYNLASLQAYWQLEANFNYTKVGYNLTNNNSPTFGAAKFNNGFVPAPASHTWGKIAISSAANLNISGSQTWIAYVKVGTAATNGYIMSIYDTTNDRSLRLGSSVLTFAVPGLSTNTSVSSSVTINDNSEHLIFGIYDSANSKLKIWVDNTKTEVTASGSSSMTAGSANFNLGSIGNLNGFEFAGAWIDECAILNEALTDTQVQAHYAGTDSLTNILKIGGVTYATTKKVGGIAIASIKKIAGLA